MYKLDLSIDEPFTATFTAIQWCLSFSSFWSVGSAFSPFSWWQRVFAPCLFSPGQRSEQTECAVKIHRDIVKHWDWFSHYDSPPPNKYIKRASRCIRRSLKCAMVLDFRQGSRGNRMWFISLLDGWLAAQLSTVVESQVLETWLQKLTRVLRLLKSLIIGSAVWTDEGWALHVMR